MTIDTQRPSALLVLFAAAVLGAGLLVLVGAKPAWAAWWGFSDSQNYPVGESPLVVTSADFNGDGEKDLATVNFGNYPDATFPRPEIPGGVSVLLGKGDGTFQPNQDFEISTNRHPQSLTSAHIDGDDFADLVVPNPVSDDVSVFLSDGDGTFQEPRIFAAGDAPRPTTSGDFDRDGNADLAVPNKISDDVSILLGNGDGTFQDAREFLAGDAPESAINADFDGDGNADLAVLRKSLDAASVLLGNGDGTFQDPKSFPVEDETTSLVGADLDGDNKSDLATAHRPSFGSRTSPPEGVSVFLSNGDGTFQAARSFPVAWDTGYRRNPEQVIAADFNRDKKLDLATSNRGAFFTGYHGISVLLGYGHGTFQDAQEFPFGINPSSLTSADFDGDNFPDLAVADEGHNDLNFETFPDEVSVLMSIPGPTEVVIDSGPPQLTDSITATFSFSSPEPDVNFECKLDDRAYEACASPQTYTNLSEGYHSFEVKAIGAAGPELSGSAYWSWTVDNAPDTTIDSGPSEGSYVNSTSASFSFSSEAGSTYQCSRDGSTFASCTSPTRYSNLSQGSHTFRVRAIDKAGNIDASPATRSWFVDTVVPKGTISVNGGVSSTASRSVTLNLAASDPSPASGVASMRFRNEGTSTWSSWFDYSTSWSWTLSAGAGTKTVYVQYKDRAGNISAAASDTIRFRP